MPLTYRQPRAGCAHCQKLGAAICCSGCGRMICEACAQTWRSCPQPAAQTMRLGLGRRLRACGACGSHGLSVSVGGRCTAVDLDRLQRDARPIARYYGAPWPLVTKRGEVLQLSAERSLPLALVVDRTPDVVGDRIELSHIPRALVLSEDDALCTVVGSDEVIEVLDLEQRRSLSHISEPGTAFVSAALHSGSDRLIAASYQQLYIFEARSGRRVYGYAIDDLPLGVEWLGLGASRAAVVGSTEHYVVGTGRAVRVYELNAAGLPSKVLRPERRIYTRRRSVVAALSDDGRLVALGNAGTDADTVRSGAPLLLINIDDERYEQLEGHSDALVFLRWVRDAEGREALVSADADNRVMIWPRVGDSVAKPRPTSRGGE